MTYFLRESGYGGSYFMVELQEVENKLEVEGSADLSMCFRYILDDSIKKSKRELFAEYIASLQILLRKEKHDLDFYEVVEKSMKHIAKEFNLDFVED